jgi:hypothetical protein
MRIGPCLGMVTTFAGEIWEHNKPVVRIFSNPDQIQTIHLLSMSLKVPLDPHQ